MLHCLPVRIEGEFERVLSDVRHLLVGLDRYFVRHVDFLSFKLATVLFMILPELLRHEPPEAPHTPELLASVLGLVA